MKKTSFSGKLMAMSAVAILLAVGFVGVSSTDISYASGMEYEPVENFEYVIFDKDGIDRLSIRGYIGNSTVVYIPPVINNLPVYNIQSAFKDNTTLQSVIIPYGIEHINSSSFENCTALESVIIPDSVTSIGSNTFSGCSALKSIIIPDSVTSLSSGVFHKCRELKHVTLSNNIPALFKDAFKGCWSLEHIIIPNSVTALFTSAFSNCTALKSIILHDNITHIYDRVFEMCTSLKFIKIPDKVKRIGIFTFSNCHSLEYLIVGEQVETIEGNAFHNSNALETLYVRGNNLNYFSETFPNLNVVQYTGLELPYSPPTTSPVVNLNWVYTPTILSGVDITILNGPDWISVDNGTIYGIPHNLGDYIFTIKINKEGYEERIESFTVSVVSNLVILNNPTNGVIFWVG